MLLFADTNIVIYLIEQPAGFGPRATAYVNAAKAVGVQIVVSDLVRMECRVGPLAASDTINRQSLWRAGLINNNWTSGSCTIMLLDV